MGKSNLSIKKKPTPAEAKAEAKKAKEAARKAARAASAAKDNAEWRAKIEKQERDLAPMRRELKRLREKKEKELKRDPESVGAQLKKEGRSATVPRAGLSKAAWKRTQESRSRIRNKLMLRRTRKLKLNPKEAAEWRKNNPITKGDTAEG